MNAAPRILFVLLFLPPPVVAHHSRIEFESSEPREIAGEVVSVFWRNPHVHLRIRSEGGEMWDLEGADIVSLDRRGLPRDIVKVGDRVRAAGFPSARRENFLDITNVLLPGGTEAVFSRRTEPRWSDETVGYAPAPSGEPSRTAASGSGIFRVWQRARINLPELADLPLTAAARAYHEAYEPLADDPILSCTQPGMPRIMTFMGPHPVEFFAGENEITLRLEYLNTVRVIHMEPPADAALPPASLLGYSVGRWEGDTLVVTTTRINWPHFDLNPPLLGFPQSEAVEIVERFSLQSDGNEMAYDITVTDPVTFTEPLNLNDYLVWRWDPDIRRESFECHLNEALSANN